MNLKFAGVNNFLKEYSSKQPQMKTILTTLCASFVLLSFTFPYLEPSEGGFAGPGAIEPAKKWEILFDGKDLGKWRQSASDNAPGDGWVIEDGAISVVKGRKGGDIITRDTYTDFEFQCEYKLTKAANSGIKYHVSSIRNSKTGKFSNMGIEYQIIDDLDYPEIKNDPYGVSSTGSVYLIYPPKGKKIWPVGAWNKVKIVSKGKRTQHWLNGVKVADYDRDSEDFRQKVAATKFKDYPDYARVDTGHIMITDHGDRVYFRNIRVKRLK